MNNHWHFYCDESGEFEKQGRTGGILVGMLIPEDKKSQLAEQYSALKNKHNITEDFVHATKLHKKGRFKAFKDDLINATLNAPIRLLRMRFQEDLLDESAGEIAEAFACNRYLYMIQALIEHFLFYTPEDYGKSLAFTLNPNSRVFPCGDSQVAKMRALGFDVFKPKPKLKDNAAEKQKEINIDYNLVHVWDSAALRIFLNRLQLEHLIDAAVLGERQITAIDLQVAQKSKDPFVHWSDVVTWQIMWKPEEENTKKLIDSLHIDAVYGDEDRAYKWLCRLFLSGRHKEFIERYLSSASDLTTFYYQRQLKSLFEKGVNQMGALSLGDLLSLEAMANDALRRSQGNWRFVSKLVDKLFELADLLPDAQARQDKTKWLKFNLNNHRLSFHNHRGEVLPAWQAVRNIDELNLGLQTVAQWRTWAEYQNRRAVTCANIFAFEEGNRTVLPVLACLEKSLECLNGCTGLALQDETLGKLKGTVAQNDAFLAPYQPELFERAEKMFLAAKAQFERPDHRLRQNIYLAHLYIDAHQTEKLMAIWAEIEQDASFQSFWDNPNPTTAKYMQFVVALQLKIAACLVKTETKLLKRYDPLNLKQWFGQAMDEHPFELIYAYLGQLAANQSDKPKTLACFKKALNIPAPATAQQQVTLEAIRAQILVRWALCLNTAGDTKGASDKVQKAIAIMKRIGSEPDHRPVLHIENGRPTDGWFKDGYEALLKAGKQMETAACERFLRCFTFNYW